MTEVQMPGPSPQLTGMEIHVDYRVESSAGAVADVYGLDSAGNLRPVENGLVVPAGKGQRKATLRLDPGEYLVQTRFPAGQVINTAVRVMPGETSYLSVTPPVTSTSGLDTSTLRLDFDAGAAVEADLPADVEFDALDFEDDASAPGGSQGWSTPRRTTSPDSARPRQRTHTVAIPPTPQIEVADYIEMGRLVAQWATEPASRPADVEELKKQLDGIAVVPDRIRTVEFAQSTLDHLVLRLPEKEMIEESLGRISDPMGDGRYPLPQFYEDFHKPGFEPVMRPLDTLLARVGDYTIAQGHIRDGSTAAATMPSHRAAAAPRPTARAGNTPLTIRELAAILKTTHELDGKPVGLDYLARVAGEVFPEAGDENDDILSGVEPSLQGSHLEFVPAKVWDTGASYLRPLGCMDGDNAWVVQVPPEWRASSGTVGFRVVFYRNERPGVAVLPDDPETAALLEFLRRGDLMATHDLVLSAVSSLFGKSANPWAAAAGALALVQNRRWNPRARITPQWTGWIDNLRVKYPEVPDGPILHAWVMALDDSERASRGAATDKARRNLRRTLEKAIEAPLPLFGGTFRLLLDGLKLTADLGTNRDAEEAVRLPSLRLDPRQVFTTFRMTYRSAASEEPRPVSRKGQPLSAL
jgi:hypothetical protein